MATLLCHIRIQAGSEAKFEKLARELHAATHAEETGCRRYEYWRAAQPRLYYALLAFDDFHAFLAHQTSDHHEDRSPALGKVIEDIRLEWVDPVEGASDLPRTAAQDVPDGADELVRQYHEMYAPTIQDWWRVESGHG